MTMLTTLKDNKELAKLVLFTPFLYPERGFTIWNFINIFISSFNKNNEYVNKFNANNSAGVFFGCLSYHIHNPQCYNKWLKKDNYSLFTEKIFHILPVVYYYYKGYYSTTNIPMSCLSLFYEYTWANTCGKYILDKGDMYFPLKTYTDWCFVWCFICYGHFFNLSSNYIFKGLLLHLTCKITKLVTPQLCQL